MATAYGDAYFAECPRCEHRWQEDFWDIGADWIGAEFDCPNCGAPLFVREVEHIARVTIAIRGS